MFKLNQRLRKLNASESQAQLDAVLSDEMLRNRTPIALRVCAGFDFLVSIHTPFCAERRQAKSCGSRKAIPMTVYKLCREPEKQ